MAQATVDTNTRRRDFLALTAACATAVMAARPALASPPDDSALLKLEEQIFEQYWAATAYDDEIIRLSEIWTAESKRLYAASLDAEGNSSLTPQERWDIVTKLPECVEHDRLCRLHDPHQSKMSALIDEMWAMPAHTPEGRRAKVQVLLACILGDEWTAIDERTGDDELMARNLLIEFVGGEPGAQLRDQFASGAV
jgi:hypothetical protein